MARKPRIYGRPDSCYSIVTHINDQHVYLFADRKVVRMIKKVIKQAKYKFDLTIYADQPMGTHLHLKFKPPKNGRSISYIMNWINSVIAIRYNKMMGRKGRLWRDRFKSCIIDSPAYFINTAVYFALNPERAGICAAEEYPFGSAIFLYKLQHPFPEFEEFRDIYTEAYPGYHDEVKRLVALRKTDKQFPQGISMAPRPIGRPKKENI